MYISRLFKALCGIKIEFWEAGYPSAMSVSEVMSHFIELTRNKKNLVLFTQLSAEC